MRQQRVFFVSPLFILATLVACGGGQPPQGAFTPEVSVATVPERDITEWDEYTARLEAVDSVEVRPQVSGYLEKVLVPEGKEVKKGELLFLIDSRVYRAELERAQAAAEQARIQAELAKADLTRGEKLLSTRAMSQEEFEQRNAASRNAIAAVRSAEAAVAQARLNVEFTRITSPIDGRVGRAEVTVGNLVSGGQGGAATQLTTVVSLDPMYAYFDAAEQDYLKYVGMARRGERASSRDVDNPVRMALGDENGFIHEGHMDFVDNRVDTRTGTIRGRAVFRNSDRFLTPGMFVRLRLIGSGVYRGVLISDRAVATDQDRRYVMVLGAGNKVEYRPVTLGPIFDGLRVVRSGLKAGEKVVVNGLQRIRPGVQVTPRSVPMDSETG
ncbi:MAG: efflux RND transporter periplasmic adaptor subunit [Steroidobacteraceae bacterium]